MEARLDRAKVDIDFLRRNLPATVTNLDRFSASGFTTSKGDQVGGSSPPGIAASPVERAASTPDPAAEMRRRFERKLLELNAIMDDLMQVYRWANTTTREGADAPAKGCEMMAQVNVWEAAALTRAGGNLEQPRWLGVWAKRFVIATGRLPTKAECEARSQGRYVKRETKAS